MTKDELRKMMLRDLDNLWDNRDASRLVVEKIRHPDEYHYKLHMFGENNVEEISRVSRAIAGVLDAVGGTVHSIVYGTLVALYGSMENQQVDAPEVIQSVLDEILEDWEELEEDADVRLN